MWWSVGTDGPCSPVSGICRTRPNDKLTGESRFSIHQIRWAYWVVKQNAVRVRHKATGLDFIALVPYYNMLKKDLRKGGGVTFDFDGSVNIRAGANQEEGAVVGITPGNFSDSEFFLRYFRMPSEVNPHTVMKLSLPGTIPKGSKFHYCMKGTRQEQNRGNVRRHCSICLSDASTYACTCGRQSIITAILLTMKCICR
jgi:hypothetical protein